MPLKLYHFPVSGPSRSAWLAAKAVGVPIEVEIVDLYKKEQHTEDYLKINPQHTVPTLDDDGFILWESRAIACYLADKYGKDDQLYPKDVQRRAVVHQRLFFDSTSLYVKFRAIVYPILFRGVTEITERLKKDLDVSLGYLDGFLKDTKWVAGDNATIADTTIYASVSTILAVGWDLTNFPNIQRWLKQCATLPGSKENEEGAKAFGESVRKNLKQ